MTLPADILKESICSLSAEWPENVEPLLEALSSNSAHCSLSPRSLESLRGALSSNRVGLHEIASYLLAEASLFDPAALDLIMSLSISAKAAERFNAIICLTAGTPEECSLTVLVSGLRDRSSRVRAKAADWILRLRLPKALPALENALGIELNAGVRSTMELTLHLLRDGYMARPNGEKEVWFTVLAEVGITSKIVDASLVESLGAKSVARQLRGDST